MLELARTMDSETSKEEGCVYYKHAIDVDNDCRFILSEIWVSAAALKNHFRSAHFSAFRADGKNLGLQSKVVEFNATEMSEVHPEYWKTLLHTSEL